MYPLDLIPNRPRYPPSWKYFFLFFFFKIVVPACYWSYAGDKKVLFQKLPYLAAREERERGEGDGGREGDIRGGVASLG